MNNWTAKVKVSFEDPETGKIKARTESYLVEAEDIKQVYEIVKKYFNGSINDYEIRGVNKSGISLDIVDRMREK